MLTFAVAVAGLVGTSGWRSAESADPARSFACSSPEIVDGDTLRCDGRRVRLHGIDAPELPGHCRPGRSCTPGDPYASSENLRRMASSAALRCRQRDVDSYGRIVARCSAGEQDLSCGQIEAGHPCAAMAGSGADRRHRPVAFRILLP